MSDRPEPRPWRRRYRLSLRGLMIAIAALCGGLGWAIHRVDTQRDAVAAIEGAGGKVMYDCQWRWKQGVPVRAATTRWPARLVERIGIDYFYSVTYVDLKCDGSDELLARIGQLPRLEYLQLAHSPVTDAGLAHLRGLTALRWLSHEDTKIGDAGLEYLRGLTRLGTLLLTLSNVGDAGLPHLKPLTGLKTRSLHPTSVSDDAGWELQRAMPGTRIAATGWPDRNDRRAFAIYDRAMRANTDR